LCTAKQVEELHEPVPVRDSPQVVSIAFQDVKDMEGVPHGLAIEEEFAGKSFRRGPDGFRDSAFDAPAVDADDFVSHLEDEQAFAVELGLEVKCLVFEQGLRVLDGIEELRPDGGYPLTGAAVGLGIRALGVTFGGLLADQFFVDACCGIMIDWR